MSIRDVSRIFGQYAMYRKNASLHNDIQDEYYATFIKIMTGTKSEERELNRLMVPELISAYMKTIPHNERENNTYRTINFLILQYNRSIVSSQQQLKRKEK